MKKTFILSALFVFLTVVFLFFSLYHGINIEDTTSLYILKNLRLPRSVTAIFCGAILALCGLIFQCVFKNPMADSYILGISSGASFCVAIPYFLNGFLRVPVLNSSLLPLWALSGAVITSVLLFSLNRRNTYQLLLCGIAANFFLSAASTLLIYLSKHQMDTVLYWSMGSFSNTGFSELAVMFPVLIFIALVCLSNSSKMDILMMDDTTAVSNGIRTERTKLLLLISASFATAICVSFCGVIGFVGLMSPHTVRLMLGPKHSKLVLPVMFFGSMIMIFSDCICKTVIYPSELPVGLVTSLLGAPVFFIILKRGSYR